MPSTKKRLRVETTLFDSYFPERLEAAIALNKLFRELVRAEPLPFKAQLSPVNPDVIMLVDAEAGPKASLTTICRSHANKLAECFEGAGFKVRHIPMGQRTTWLNLPPALVGFERVVGLRTINPLYGTFNVSIKALSVADIEARGIGTAIVRSFSKPAPAAREWRLAA